MEAELAHTLGDPAIGELRAGLAGLVRALGGSDLPPLRPVW